MISLALLFASTDPAADAGNAPIAEIAKIDSIEDSFGYFHSLGRDIANWFAREEYHLLWLGIGVVVTLLVMFAVRWFLLCGLRRIAARTSGQLAEEIVLRIAAPTQLLILTIGLSTGRNLVHFPVGLGNWLSKFFYACFIVVVLWGIFRLIGVLDSYYRRRAELSTQQMNVLLVDMLRKAIKAAVWTLAAIFVAQNLFNLNVTALVTGAGVAGLAIAFAAQNTVANLFGAMSIITDRTFKVGDRVTIGDANGSIETVGLRSVRLRSLDGTVWTVPNRIAADSTIENITERPCLKHAFTLGLVYSTTPDQMRRALEILGEILDHHPAFSPEQPPLYFFTDFKEFSLGISVVVWFQTTDFVQCQKWKQEINLAILDKFNAAGLEFAFPTSTNYLIKQGV